MTDSETKAEIKQFIRLSVKGESDYILLRNLTLEPDSPWPPPETLWLIVGHAALELGMDPIESGLLVHDPEAFDEIAAKIDELGTSDGWKPTYSVAEFKRVTCSTIGDEELARMTHVARGAQYVAV